MLGAMLTWSTLGYGDTLYKTNTASGTFLTVNPAANAIVPNAFAGGEALTAADIIAFTNFIVGFPPPAVPVGRNFIVSSTDNANVVIGGILLSNPGNPLQPVNTEPIIIQNNANVNNTAQNQTLTIGSGGINLYFATQSLTFSNQGAGALSLRTSADQFWQVRDGRTITVSQGVNLNTLGNDIYISGGATGSGTVDFLGNISGGGDLIITGPPFASSGLGNTVRLAGNNGPAGLGNVLVGRGSELLIDQSTSGQNKLNDTGLLYLDRGTVNFQGNGGGVETVGALVLDGGLNQVTRTAGTGTLRANNIVRFTGGLVNFASAGLVATEITNTNGILGGWAVINNSDWAALDSITSSAIDWANATDTVAIGGVANGTKIRFTGSASQVPGGLLVDTTYFVVNSTAGSFQVSATSGGTAINLTNDSSVADKATVHRINGNGDIIALSSYTNRTGAWGAASVLNAPTNVNTTGSITAVPTDTINSLRFSGAHNLTQTAATTLTITSGGILKNNNSTTTISGGTITAGVSDSTPDELYVWNNNALMTLNSVVANNGSAALSLTKSGAGILQIGGANTYTGTTTITAGQMNLGGNSPATDVATFGTGDIINHGLLLYNKQAGATLAQGTIANNISGSGSLTIQRGTVTLGGNNTYFGDTVILGTNPTATLRANSATGFSPNSLMDLRSASGGLNLNGFSNSVAGLTSTLSTTTVNLGANTLTLTGNSPTIFLQASLGNPQNFPGIITGTGGLVKSGGYTQNLTGAGALSYTGTTTVNAGVLQTNKVMSTGGLIINGGNFISNVANALPTTAVVNIAGANGVWTINHGFDQSVASVAGVGDSRVTMIAGASNQTLTVTDSGGAPTIFNGVIAMSAQNATGVGNVVKNGTNTWVLGGANSYTGSTTINGGIIQIDAASTVEVIPNRTALTLANVAGVALDLNGKSETIGSLAGGGALGGNVILGAGTLTTGLNNGTTTFNGMITAASASVGAVTKVGSGTMTLTGANSFAQLNVLDGGITLNNAGGNALADTTSVFLRRLGSTLTLQTNETIGSLTSGTNAVLALGANTLTLGDATSTLAAGVITGTGGLVKNGAGTLTLAGTNSYTGSTVINAGTVTLGVPGLRGDILSDSSAVVMAQGTTLNIGPNINSAARSFERIASLSATNPAPSPAPSVNLVNGTNSAALVLGDATDTTFIGNIVGNNGETAVMKVGTGTFTYQTVATDTFDGAFRVENGTLRSLGNGLDAANFVILNNAATSVFRVSANDTIANINGGGRSLGFAPTTMGGTTGAGAVAVGGGSPATASMGGNLLAGGNGRISIDSGVTLTLGGANPNPNPAGLLPPRVFGGIIEGLGGLTKTNAYVQELWGANTYSGLTTVTTGTLRPGIYGGATGVGTVAAGGIGSLGASTSLVVTGGILDLNGANQTVTGLAAGSTGGTIQLLNGALTFSNQTTQSSATVFTGNLASSLTINGAGNLTLSGNSSAFLGSVNVGSGQTLTLNGVVGVLGDTARVNLAGGSTLAVTLSDTIGSLSGGGNVTIAASRVLTLSEARSGAISAAAYTGNVSGAGSVALSSVGGLRIAADQTYTGGTTLSPGSTLYLDYSGAATSIIPNTGALTLSGARMLVIGGAVTDNAASTTLNAGSTFIGAATTIGSTTLVNLATITRAASNGGTLQVGGSTTATANANTAGILGGWAVHGLGAQPTSWAVSNGAATAISGLLPASYTSDTWGAGNHTTVTSSTSQSGTTNDLRFNSAGSNTVTLTAAGTITAGGILVTPFVGIGTSTVTGAGALASGAGNELILHQYNPQGDLVLNNVGGTNTIITKAGPGRAVITNSMAGTGTTFIGNGILQLGSGGATGMAGSGAITNHGILSVNRSNAQTIGAIISGIGEVWQTGAGALTLSGANTYQGRTTIFPGSTLTVATSASALGAPFTTQVRGANLTAVHAAGVLDVNVGGNLTEWINLNGGTLRARSAALTTFNAPLTVVGSGGTIDLGAGAAVVHVQSGGVFTMSGSALNITGVASASTMAFTSTNSAAPNYFGGPVNIGANAHLMFGNATATGNLGSEAFTIAAGGSLSINRTDAILQVPNAISGAGTFSLGAAGAVSNTVGAIGTVIMTGTNSYAGPVLVRRGLLQIGNDSFAGTANTSSVSSTIGSPGVIWSIGDNSTAANGGDAITRFSSLRDIVTMTGDFRLTPNTTGTAGNGRTSILQKNNVGTLEIAGRTAGIDVNGTGAGATVTGASSRLDVVSGVLRIAGGLTDSTLVAGSAFTGDILLTGGFFEIAGNANNTIGTAGASGVGGFISGNGAAILHNSTGTLTLQGINTSTTGIGLAINKGTVIANYTTPTPGAIASAASATGQPILNLASTAGLRVGMTLTGTGVAGFTITQIVNGTSVRLSSNLTAASSGSYTPATQGALADAGFVSLAPGATLQLNTAEVTGMVGAARGSNVILNGTLTTGGANLNGGGFNAGLVTGPGAFIKAGTGGTAINYSLFNPNNSFAGDLQINHSLVFLGSLANAGVNSSAGAGSVIRLGTGADNSAIQTGIDYRGAATSSNRSIFLEGTGGSLQRTISANGNGELKLSGPIDKTSATDMTLFIRGSNTAQQGDITYTYNQAYVPGAPVAGYLATLLNGINTISGNITQTGGGVLSLTKDDASWWYLSGANTFTGTTITVNAGQLYVNTMSGASSSLGNMNAAVKTVGLGTGTTGASLIYTGIGETSNAVLRLNSTTGGINLANLGTGALVLNNTAAQAAPGGGAKTFTIGRFDDTPGFVNEYAGGIVNNSSDNTTAVAKSGLSTWRISGTNTNTGNWTVNEGVLQLANGSAIENGRTVTVNNTFGRGARLEVIDSETIGALAGNIGSTVGLGAGATLTVVAGSSTYSGIIDGSGGFTRSTNDSTNRTTTLTNKNTYTGVTTITNPATAIAIVNVFHLANGGLPSGIGASSNAASNLILNSGGNGAALSWLGFTNQTTDRLFTMDPTAAIVAIIGANGSVVSDFAPRLTFSNTGPIAFTVPNDNAGLQLEGSTISDNEFNPQLTNNGTQSTNFFKAGPGMWVLTNPANTFTGGTGITGGTLAITNAGAIGTGTIAINGGAGTGLQIRGGVGGMTLSNNFTNATTDGGIQATGTGANVINGTLTFNGTNAGFRVDVSAGASLNFTNQLTGGGLGTNSIFKFGAGTLTLSGSNNYTDGVSGNGAGTIVAGGTLRLDYSTQNNSKLYDRGTLNLGWTGSGSVVGLGADDNVAGQTNITGQSGGRLTLAGGSHIEIVGSNTIAIGSNTITRESGTGVIGLNSITRNAGGTVDFSIGGFAATNNTNGTGGLLGGYATVAKTDWATTTTAASTVGVTWTDASDTISVGSLPNGSLVEFSGLAIPGGLGANQLYFVVNSTGTDFQVSLTAGGPAINLTNSGATTTLDRPGFINPILAANYNNGLGTDTYGAGFNTDVISFTPTAGGEVTNTLRFNQAGGGTLALGGTLSLQSAGVLLTPNSGNVIITGGAIRNNANTAGLEAMAIQQHSASALQIDAVIQNNTNAQALTKSGTGKVFLNAINTQTGTLFLNEGEIQVGGTIAAPAIATDARLSGGGAVNISQGATLTFNSINASTHDFGVIQGGGTIQTLVGNTHSLLFNDDNNNFTGELIFNGGTVQIAGNNNALGSPRGRATFNAGTILQINDNRNSGKLITFAEGTSVTTLAAATGATLSGKQTLNNTTVGGFTYDLAAGSGLNVSGLIQGSNGFTKVGNGRLTLSGTNFTGVIDGFTAVNTNPSLLGQVLINAGELFITNARATGATGLGHETIIANGATLDVRNIAFNYGDDPSPTREIFVVEGAGTFGAGALRSTVATSTLAHLVLNNHTTIGTTYRTNDFSAGRIDLNVFDTDITPGQTFTAPTLDANGYNVTKIGTGDLVFHEVNFTNIGAYAGSTAASGIGILTVSEGEFRLETNSPFPYSNLSSSTLVNGQPTSPTSATAGAITPTQIGSIVVNYTGPTQGNDGNGNIVAGAAGLAINLGARLEFFRQHNVVHTTPITLGTGYIDLRADTIPKVYTYLDGTITLTGNTNGTNSVFNIQGGGFAATTNNAITGAITPFGGAGVNPGAVLLLTGNGGAGTSLTGTGGLTKVGDRELRILAPSNFTGDTIITREVATGLPIGEAGHSRAEMFSATLAGNGTLGGTANIILDRSGVLRVDNTNFLDATNNGVAGANNNNRINDAANIRFRSGTLVFDNSTANTEVLGDVFVEHGRNYLGVNLTHGSNANTTLTFDSLNRTAGSVLAISSWDSTSTFGSGTTGDSLRILVTDNGAALGASLTGAASGATDKKVITGIVGGVAPLENYLQSTISANGDYPFRSTDIITQARNVILNSGRDLMTVDAGVLRPLDDSEYASTITAGQNVNLQEIHHSLVASTAINALRFGAVSDNQGNNGGGLIGGSQLANLQDTTTTLTLHDNAVLQIASGMIVSANFGIGTNQDMTTRIRGGIIDFGTQEGVIINSNLFFRLGDGIFAGNNLEIGSALAGSGGVTKGGTQQVTFDGRNTFSGVTSVVEGNLFLRNSMALGQGGAGNGVTIAGSGNLLLQAGINVGSVLGNSDINAAGREDILVKSVATDGQAALRSTTAVNRYLGNLILDNIDSAGLASHTELFTGNLLNNRFRVRYVVDANATLIHQGDIFGGPTPVTNDMTITTSRYLSTDTSLNGYILMKGQFGDRQVAGNAAAIANPVSLQPTDASVTNVNEVLRFYIGNNNAATDELNVNVYQPWDAVGRVELMRGFMRYLADPADPTSNGDFRTTDALSKIPVANNISQAGFQIGGSIIDNTAGDGSITAFLLTKAGQTMRQPNWTITTNGSNNNGSVIIGGENETGTVIFGDSSQNSTITLGRNLRLYANDGGTVQFDARLNGAVALVKSGRGTVVLNGSAAGASTVNNLMIAGGDLVFDFRGANNARIDSNSSINFAGGTITNIASGIGNSTQSFGGSDGNDINIRPGGTEIIAKTTLGTGQRSMTVNIGSFSATGTGADLQRSAGGTVNFVEDQSATTDPTAIARITLNTRTDPTFVFNTLIPWATYGNQSRTAIDFAMADGGDGGDLRAFTRAPDELQNNVALWSGIPSGLDGSDLSENGGSGYFGALAASTQVNSILFNAPADSSVQVGANNLSISSGGILVASTAGASNKSIGGTGAIKPVFVTARGATTSGQATITGLDSTAGFHVGMPISGTGIPADAVVVSVDSPTQITIDSNATATGTPTLSIGNSELILHHYGTGNLTVSAPIGGPSVAPTGGSSTNGSSTLTVASTAGLQQGMIITGTSIPAGATIISIPNATTIIISANASADQTGQTYTAYPQVNVTIAGPSTTNAATVDSSGAVVLSSTGGSYIGRININGAVLSINDEGNLGLVNRTVSQQDAVYLNGGTLRWTGGTASLDPERGFRFGGNGGVIDVTDGSAALTINAAIDSENTQGFINGNATGNTSVGSGDLIKMGAGTLSLAGTSGNYQGMIDVREGTLRVATTSTGAAATIAMFGTSRSFIDGTVFRPGTNLEVHMSNGNATGDWAFDEWFRFDGNNIIRAGDPAANANARPIQFNGVIDLVGNVTIDTSPQTTLRLNNAGGYLTGAGNITKIGQGVLEFRENNVEWTGNLAILEGTVRGLSQGRPFGVGTGAIILGSDSDQGIANLEMLPENAVSGTYYEIFQDVNVVYNPLQTKRITINAPQGANDLDTHFHGDITLNDNLGLLITDNSIPVGGKFTYANFHGDFKDGVTTSGNLVLHVDETASSTANERTNGVVKGYFVFNGNNSNWSGDVTIGLNNVFDRDETTILRLGNGNALTNKNDVTMNQNSVLQVGGQNIAIGSLFVNGPATVVVADGSSGPNTIIENAASAPATLTINQTTPVSTEVVWNATFQNGSPPSHFFADPVAASGALSITKAGNGWATLVQDNHYTGATNVTGGILQVGRGGIGDTGASNALGTTVSANAILAGTGVVQGGGNVQNLGGLAPGDQAGTLMGTLTFNGSVTLANGSTSTLQAQRATYNNSNHLGYGDGGSYTGWLGGIPSDLYSNALADPVTTAQHDVINVLGALTWGAGTKVVLQNNGYSPVAGDIFDLFDWFSVVGAINVGATLRTGAEAGTDLDLFELGGDLRWDTSLFNSHGILAVVGPGGIIPEPSRVLLVLIGLLGAFFRRRRS